MDKTDKNTRQNKAEQLGRAWRFGSIVSIFTTTTSSSASSRCHRFVPLSPSPSFSSSTLLCSWCSHGFIRLSSVCMLVHRSFSLLHASDQCNIGWKGRKPQQQDGYELCTHVSTERKWALIKFQSQPT